MNTTSKLAYAIAFQIGWFVCILTNDWISIAYTITFLCIHFWFLKSKTSSLTKELLWIIVVFMCGVLLETISFSAGFLHYLAEQNRSTPVQLPPIWLMNLWLLFAIALRSCLSVVFSRPRITYLLASIAIPLNYYAGAKLNNEVAVNNPYLVSLTLVSLMWIALLWVLNKIQRRYFEDIFNAR